MRSARSFHSTALAELAALAATYGVDMVLDYNSALAIAGLNAIYDTNFPAGSEVDLRTGAPTGADNAAGGTLLAAIVLPSTPWAAATGTGSKSKSGTWSVAAVAAGVAANYRLRNSAATMVEEGTVTLTGSGGDATLDNTNITVGQNVTIVTLTRTL